MAAEPVAQAQMTDALANLCRAKQKVEAGFSGLASGDRAADDLARW